MKQKQETNKRGHISQLPIGVGNVLEREGHQVLVLFSLQYVTETLY